MEKQTEEPRKRVGKKLKGVISQSKTTGDKKNCQEGVTKVRKK